MQQCIYVQNFSQFAKLQTFGPNLSKNMTDKSFEKINIKIIISIQQCTSSEYRTKFAPKNMTDKNLNKINIKIVISIQQCKSVTNFG